MRLLLFLFILLFGSMSAYADNSYRVPRDTAQLLSDALQPAITQQQRFEKRVAAESLRYRVPRDIEVLRPHLAELESLYQNFDREEEAKSSVAAVLLALGSGLDREDLILAAMKYPSRAARGAYDTPEILLGQLSDERRPEKAAEILDRLYTGEGAMKWYNNYAALGALADTTSKLVPVVSDDKRHDLIGKIVRIRMKLADRFASDKIEEEKFHGTITIWDDKTEDDVNALLGRFDDLVCAYPPKEDLKTWHYTFVGMHAMFETGAPKVLSCHG